VAAHRACAGLLVPAERQCSQSEGARIPEQQAPRWGAGRVLLQQRRQCGLASRATPAAGRRRRARSVRQLVAYRRVEPPIVRVGQGLLRLAALVPLGTAIAGDSWKSWRILLIAAMARHSLTRSAR
jgi:hypothetical protein